MELPAHLLVEGIARHWPKPLPATLQIALAHGLGVVQHGLDLYVVLQHPIPRTFHDVPVVVAGSLDPIHTKRHVRETWQMARFVRHQVLGLGARPPSKRADKWLPLIPNATVWGGNVRLQLRDTTRAAGMRVEWHSVTDPQPGDCFYIATHDGKIQVYLRITEPHRTGWLKIRCGGSDIAPIGQILDEFAADYRTPITGLTPPKGSLPAIDLTVRVRDFRRKPPR